MNKQNEYKDVVQAVRDRLIYYKDLGVKEVPKQARKKTNTLENLEDIRADIGDCTRCKLHKDRTHIVFGEGNPKAEIMFIGEGPGHDEDVSGRPFVGRAGQLLTKIIEAMKFKRSDVYIANIVKCRPPNNRAPEPDEVATCEGFLIRQISVIKPKIIVCLGSVAAQNLLKTDKKISVLRGEFIEIQVRSNRSHEYNRLFLNLDDSPALKAGESQWKGVTVMPTYHPAFLLRNPSMKKAVWDDMKKVLEFLKKEKE